MPASIAPEPKAYGPSDFTTPVIHLSGLGAMLILPKLRHERLKEYKVMLPTYNVVVFSTVTRAESMN